MRCTPRTLTLAAVMAFLVLAAACGDAEDASDGTAPPTDAPPTDAPADTGAPDDGHGGVGAPDDPSSDTPDDADAADSDPVTDDSDGDEEDGMIDDHGEDADAPEWSGPDIDLSVEVTLEEDGADSGTITLACAAGAAPQIAATGTAGAHLDTDVAAIEACEAVVAAEFLVEGLPEDEMCTQIYGGPETAHITGTIDGQTVDIRLDRTDGCGIDRWQRLAPLLGDRGDASTGPTS